MFEGMKKVVTTKTGPNDVSGCVIWAISTCFIFLSCVFYIVTNNLCYIQTLSTFQGMRKAVTTKQAQTMHCLGHKYMFFLKKISCSCILTIFYYYI